MRPAAGRPASARSRLAVAAAGGLLLAVGVAGDSGQRRDRGVSEPRPAEEVAWDPPPLVWPADEGRLLLVAVSGDLAGSGPAAFHPRLRRLAWARGSVLVIRDPAGGPVREHDLGGPITDLAYDDGGGLWVLAGRLVGLRDGDLACAGEVEALDRLLALPEGDPPAGTVTAARDLWEDGMGPVRVTVRYGLDCRQRAEATTRRLREGDSDDGALARRRLQAAGITALEGDRLTLADGRVLSLPGRTVAVSPNGRWWVLDRAGRLQLRTLAEPVPPSGPR